MSSSWVIFIFLAYFATLIGIALVRARGMQNMSDYVLGGRRLSSFTAALSAGSSTTSAWTMLALPALAFSHGAVEIWVPFGAVVGIWLSWTVMAKRLRRYTAEANDALTIPEFFEVRFGDKTGILRTLTSFITIFFVIFYVSSGLVGGSKLLESILGVEGTLGILITLIAIASYTLIGGFLAVSRTDVFQAMLMLVSFVIITTTLTGLTGSPLSGIEGASADFLSPFTTGEGRPLTIAFLLSVAGWSFGAFGAQRTLQRFMAVESEDRINASRNMSTIWLVAVYALAVMVGMLARPALSDMGVLAEVADAERIYLVVSEVFFHPIVTGVLLTAVIAAVMSTADSQLLLASAVATDDLPLLRRISTAISANSRIWMGRLLLVIIGGIAAAVSILNPESVFELVSYAWGGMGAALGPSTILALFWRRFNSWGAIASIVTGTGVASIWAYLSGGPWEIWEIQPATPGFLIAMFTAIIVSLFTPKPSREVVMLFDRVNAN